MIDAETTQRFWRKVHVRDDGCWEFRGAKCGNGYRSMSVANQDVRAHRLAWMICFGQIPPGLHILHRCDDRTCVNPSHLFLGTHADNMADMAAKGRVNGPRPTHCPQGHPYDERNTYVHSGKRYCRTCQNARRAERRRKARLEGEKG